MRNVWRNRKRSLIVISSVATGVFAMLLAMGLLNGIMTQMVENTINTSLGHVSIRKSGPGQSFRIADTFTPGADISAALRDNASSVRGWAPRVKVKGMARSSASSQGVVVVGIDPVKERSVSHLAEYTRADDGSSFLEDPSVNDVLISQSMAKKLDLVPGDKLVLMIQDSKNEIIGAGLTVRGIFRTPVDSFDRFTVFTGIDRLRMLTGVGDKVSEINIVLFNRGSSGYIRDRIRTALSTPGLEALNWSDMAPGLANSIMVVDAMMYVSFAIIFIIIIFSIANTLIMAIMERFHEIGVMKSIGTPPGMIFLMILFESVYLGILGLAVGTASGVAVTSLLGAVGIDLSTYSETLRVMGSGSLIHPSVRAFDIFMASLIVLFTSFFAALFPARRAARINPVEALTHI